MKYAKANTINTQLFIAQYGKAARYPVCQAAIGLWLVEDTIRKYAKDARSMGELVISTKRQKEQARALYEQFYKEGEGKQKEVIQAEALMRKINEHFPKVDECYRANVELFTIYDQQVYPPIVARFDRECDAVARAKDVKALKALQQTRKRWNALAKGARLKDGDYRTLGILNLLRDKTIKATGLKAGNAAYTEAAFGGNRLLSDEVWQGRLTAKEIHSYLKATYGPRVAGDKDAKQVRRVASKIGIRLAEDQRGRKWKPPYPKKQESKKPHGRPRSSGRPDLVFTANFEAAEGYQVNNEGEQVSKFLTQNHCVSWTTAKKNRQELAQCKRLTSGIDREIRR